MKGLIFYIVRSDAGVYFWQLEEGVSGRIVADSVPEFVTAQDCHAAVKALQRDVPDAEIVTRHHPSQPRPEHV